VIGGGAGVAPTVGTRSGNTTAYVTTTGTQTSGDCVKIDANGNHIANGSACGSGGGTVQFVEPGLRLTLTTGVPVTTSDVTAAGTLRYTPFKSCRVVSVVSSVLADACITEISLSLTLTSGKNYDVFVSCTNATTCALALSAAWTNDTTRADALATETLCGCIVLSSDHTKLFVGTIRASGTNTTEDSAANRLVYNAYNQVRRSLFFEETTGYTYSSATMRQMRGQAANQVTVLVGAVGSLINFTVSATISATGDYTLAIGEDSTTTATLNTASYGNLVGSYITRVVTLSKSVPLGLHYYAALERAPTGTGTVAGSDGDHFLGGTGSVGM
jgi:hypothetical protein